MTETPNRSSQARPGNDNAVRNRSKSGQTSPKKPEPLRKLPPHVLRARKDLARDWSARRFRNWGGSASRPELYGMAVTVPDPAMDPHATPGRPFRVSLGAGCVEWHKSPAEARAVVEAEFVRRENAAREKRLASNPFSDPRARAALYRALKTL